MSSTAVRLAALLLALVVSSLAPQPALAATMAAVVHKASVDVRGAPDFKAPTVATLKRDAAVTVAGQQGMWFRVELPAGQPGFVRVNDLRVSHAGGKTSSAGVRALFGGQSGKGRTIETAGVRGLDEAALRTASHDAAQMAKLASYRATPEQAAALARERGWGATHVAFASEARRGERGGTSQAQKRGALASARGLLSQVGGGLFGGRADDAMKVADAAAGKSEEELAAEELALGPEITGRLLGAAPLVEDADVQRRVNLVGRWMASQTTRPELPWSFGVIESADVNAFAAPGGYVLVTRGLYDLLADDTELAAVLGHEISHVVQRDHYNVIRKQAITEAGQDIAAGEVRVGGDIAAGMAKDYVRRHGATVMLTRLDRDAEYRADEASEIYLARSGFNPLGLYAVLQKMTALGAQSPSLAQLYKTHPALGDRLDRIDRRSLAGLQQYSQRD